MIELAAELRALPQTPEIAFILHEAERGEYHDFKNQLYACGKVEVVGKLRAAADHPRTPKAAREVLRGLAQRVIEGEFDEAPDEDDIEEMRRTTPPELHAVLGLNK
jgi:hypothetical protein